MIASSKFTAQNLEGLGQFYLPRLTFEQRTGYYTGLATPTTTPYDGFLCFQLGASGEKFLAVQSGMWKTFSLT